MRVRVRLWSIVAAGAACGGGSGPTGGGGAPPPPGVQVVNISMTDYAFSPATPTVKVGTSVKWTNTGNTFHTTTSDATPPPSWDSRTVAPAGSTTCDPTGYNCQPGSPAGTYVRTFNTEGTYQYHCQFHQAQGMTGTITVTP